MKLKGQKICIDGINIEYPLGTGIKTYALTLLKTLESLGAQTSLLLSKKIQGKEVDLYQPTGKSSKGYYRSFLKFFLKKALTAKKVTQKVNSSISLPERITFYNLQRIYALSNAYFNDFGKVTKLKFQDPIDIVHLTTPLALDIEGSRKVTTIHDLIPFILPETCIIGNPKRLLQKFKYAAESSDLIFSVSEHTKRDIVDKFNINPEKIFTTYQTSIFEGFRIAENCPQYRETLARHQLREQQYFLFVGGIEPKKNISRLIKAYSRLECGPEFPLVIIGKKAWLYEDVFKTVAQVPGGEHVRFLDYAPFEELPYFFRGARACLFPSIYEGFGLPVLEALNFNCPVITSNVSSLPEVCGDAGILVDPYSVDELTQAMEAMMKDDSLRDTLAKRAQGQAAKFSQKAYANRLEEAYGLL